jgi:hypothetical protein
MSGSSRNAATLRPQAGPAEGAASILAPRPVMYNTQHKCIICNNGTNSVDGRCRPGYTHGASSRHSFLWAGGGCFSDFYIHIIDHCCWMKNTWPVKAQAIGARHYRESPEGVAYIDQNFDVYGVGSSRTT